MRQTLIKAIHTNGNKKQAFVAVEEMSELTKEICKNFNREEDNVLNIIEEIADVEIMMEQLKIIYGCETDVERIKKHKVERLKARLGNE